MEGIEGKERRARTTTGELAGDDTESGLAEESDESEECDAALAIVLASRSDCEVDM